MARRGISEHEVRTVLRAPEQQSPVRPGRIVLQSRLSIAGEGVYLLRVFIDVDRIPPEVVTAYRSSKITKYWRQP